MQISSIQFPEEQVIFKNVSLMSFNYNRWDMDNTDQFLDTGIQLKIEAED